MERYGVGVHHYLHVLHPFDAAYSYKGDEEHVAVHTTPLMVLHEVLQMATHYGALLVPLIRDLMCP